MMGKLVPYYDDKQFFVNHPNAYPIATAQVAEEVNFATNRIILEI